MRHSTHDPRCIPVPPAIREHVSRLVSDLGPTRASKRLRISRVAALQIVALGESMRGTIAIVEKSIQEAA